MWFDWNASFKKLKKMSDSTYNIYCLRRKSDPNFEKEFNVTVSTNIAKQKKHN